MKKAPLAAVAAVLLLTLAGCAGTPESPAAEPTAPAAATSAPAAETPTPTEAPTGPVEVTMAPTPPSDTNAAADRAVGEMTRWLGSKGVVLSEDEVRAAANYGCDQIDAGADPATIQPLTGEIDPEVVATFVNGLQLYCPVR
ncbi:hypothetical protein [Microbacterium resistens]